MEMRAIVQIRGRVQGVGYRAWLRGEARRVGVAGWVRNLPDDSVQAVLVGPRDRVEALLTRCHVGPMGARVTGVDVAWHEPEGDERGFVIRPTPER